MRREVANHCKIKIPVMEIQYREHIFFVKKSTNQKPKVSFCHQGSDLG